MSILDKGNGNGAHDGKANQPTLVLTVPDPATGVLAISGEVPTIDFAINMLQQALREYEAQWRMARVAAMQQQQIINAENERIRRDLMKGHSAMGVRCESVWSTVAANAMPSGSVETVMLQLPTITLAADGAGVALTFMFVITTGASSNLATLQIRRGNSIAGAFIGLGAWVYQNVGSAAGYIFTGNYVDYPGTQSLQYCLTYQQNSGGGTGSFLDGCLLAMVL